MNDDEHTNFKNYTIQSTQLQLNVLMKDLSKRMTNN